MVEPSVFSLDVYPNPNKIYSIKQIFAQNKAIDVKGDDSKEGSKKNFKFGKDIMVKINNLN